MEPSFVDQSTHPSVGYSTAHVERWSTDETVLVNQWGDQLGPWALQRAMRTARAKVTGLPSGFRFHDLRHASAKTTLDTYTHLWPDSDESTRAAIEAVMTTRAESLQTRDADSR